MNINYERKIQVRLQRGREYRRECDMSLEITYVTR